jgi:hypothetical protein
LVDFLYEEMPAAERREFLAHVDSCASCSAEVKAMASTLGHARVALRGPLAEDPPARIRARALEAAQAAVAVRAADSARPRAARVPQPEGFFVRLWKTPWLVPALGAVGVATVVLLVRVIKNPQVFPEEKPAATEMLAQPAAEPRGLPRTQPQSEAEGKPAFPSPSALDKQAAAKSDDNSYAERQHAAGKPRMATHAPSKAGKGGRRFAELSNEPLEGAGEDLGLTPVGAATTAKGGFRAAGPSKAPTPALAAQLPAQVTRVQKDETSLGHATKSLAEQRNVAVGAGAGSPVGWAEPPPPRPAAAPVAAARAPRAAEAAPAVFAAAPAPAESAPAKKTKPVGNLLDSAPQEKGRSPERAKVQSPAGVPPASPAAQTEVSVDKKQINANEASISLEERVRKAEKLFAEKKWAEAAAAFRALIAQAPSDPAAKIWRERLAAAEGAREKGRAAKAKASITNDALDGM